MNVFASVVICRYDTAKQPLLSAEPSGDVQVDEQSSFCSPSSRLHNATRVAAAMCAAVRTSGIECNRGDVHPNGGGRGRQQEGRKVRRVSCRTLIQRLLLRRTVSRRRELQSSYGSVWSGSDSLRRPRLSRRPPSSRLRCPRCFNDRTSEEWRRPPVPLSSIDKKGSTSQRQSPGSALGKSRLQLTASA